MSPQVSPTPAPPPQQPQTPKSPGVFLDGFYVAIISGDRTPLLALCLTRQCKAGGPSPPQEAPVPQSYLVWNYSQRLPSPFITSSIHRSTKHRPATQPQS